MRVTLGGGGGGGFCEHLRCFLRIRQVMKAVPLLKEKESIFGLPQPTSWNSIASSCLHLSVPRVAFRNLLPCSIQINAAARDAMSRTPQVHNWGLPLVITPPLVSCV